MSERKIKLPKLRDLKKKRAKVEPTKKARRAAVLSVPESVGEQKTVASREQARRNTPKEDWTSNDPNGERGVISSMSITSGDRRSRRIEVPEDVRARYGRDAERRDGHGGHRG
jgi:hypothetical protein